MAKPEPGSIEETILRDAQMSGGLMPICIMVADEAEKARATAFAKGRRNCGRLTFQTRAEREEVAVELRAWMGGGSPEAGGGEGSAVQTGPHDGAPLFPPAGAGGAP